MSSNLVVSVEHSGSRFLASLLGCSWLHADDEKCSARMSSSDVIAAPLRDPSTIWRSWCNRGKPDEKRFRLQFHMLNELVRRGVVVVPLDRPERDTQLELLSRLTGDDLRTDWKRMNPFQKRRELVEMDLSEVYSLPVVRAYYQ